MSSEWALPVVVLVLEQDVLKVPWVIDDEAMQPMRRCVKTRNFDRRATWTWRCPMGSNSVSYTSCNRKATSPRLMRAT